MEKLPPNINVISNPGGKVDFLKDDERRFMVIDEPPRLSPELLERLDSKLQDAAGAFADLKTESDKAAQAVQDFGQGARIVAPYLPNRKQRRAQKSRQRRK